MTNWVHRTVSEEMKNSAQPLLGSKVKCDSKTVSFLVKSLTDKK